MAAGTGESVALQRVRGPATVRYAEQSVRIAITFVLSPAPAQTLINPCSIVTRSVKYPSASRSNHGSKRHSREKLGQGVQLLITAKLQLRHEPAVLLMPPQRRQRGVTQAGNHIQKKRRSLSVSSHTKLGYASRLLPSPSILHASLGWAETVVGGSQALVHEELGAADAEVPTMAPGGRFAASVHDKQLGQGPQSSASAANRFTKARTSRGCIGI